ncbi:hypothetical protein ACFL2Q_16415 [Thermodesulfobacteriota bacterium]
MRPVLPCDVPKARMIRLAGSGKDGRHCFGSFVHAMLEPNQDWSWVLNAKRSR